MARAIRKSGVKEVPLSEIKDDLSRYLREAETQEIVITRHGKPAGLLIGFESEEDWFAYRLENDPRFLRRIEQARKSLHAGRGVRLEECRTPKMTRRWGVLVERRKHVPVGRPTNWVWMRRRLSSAGDMSWHMPWAAVGTQAVIHAPQQRYVIFQAAAVT
jgi:prevent-host-death family protein